MVGSIYFLFYGVFELIKGISGSNVDNKYRRPSPGIEHSGVWTSLVLKPKFYFFAQLNKCHLVTISVHVEWYAECCTLLNTLNTIDLPISQKRYSLVRSRQAGYACPLLKGEYKKGREQILIADLFLKKK